MSPLVSGWPHRRSRIKVLICRVGIFVVLKKMPSSFVSFLTSFHIISLKNLNQKKWEDVKPSIHSWDFPRLDDITKILVF